MGFRANCRKSAPLLNDRLCVLFHKRFDVSWIVPDEATQLHKSWSSSFPSPATKSRDRATPLTLLSQSIVALLVLHSWVKPFLLVADMRASRSPAPRTQPRSLHPSPPISQHLWPRADHLGSGGCPPSRLSTTMFDTLNSQLRVERSQSCPVETSTARLNCMRFTSSRRITNSDKYILCHLDSLIDCLRLRAKIPSLSNLFAVGLFFPK